MKVNNKATTTKYAQIIKKEPTGNNEGEAILQ